MKLRRTPGQILYHVARPDCEQLTTSAALGALFSAIFKNADFRERVLNAADNQLA